MNDEDSFRGSFSLGGRGVVYFCPGKVVQPGGCSASRVAHAAGRRHFKLVSPERAFFLIGGPNWVLFWKEDEAGMQLCFCPL